MFPLLSIKIVLRLFLSFNQQEYVIKPTNVYL